MADLVLRNLAKAHGPHKAVDDLSLTVAEGEFLTLLGPSGCGKSTTLFAVAGLDRPTAGTIRLGDTTFFDGATGAFVAPEHRNIGLVFQSYALWPHMTVAENLAFPLKLRKIGRAEQSERIREALTLVEMEAYTERYPFELSGGQQQRVALARALVYRPRLLLLDEPLSNLDAKLRERARIWLRALQERLNVTTIYVTHDQAEALAVSDRIAVMSNGRIRQLGTPTEIYEKPANAFVADFIGSSNFLPGHLVGRDDGWATVRLAEGTLIRTTATTIAPDSEVLVAVRPERIELVDGARDDASGNVLKVQFGAGSYLGSIYHYEVACGATRFRVQTARPVPAEEAFVRIPPEASTLFPRQDEPA